jgi:hypothetical protein
MFQLPSAAIKSLLPSLLRITGRLTKHCPVQEMTCAASFRLLQCQSAEHCGLATDLCLDIYPPISGMSNRRSCAVYYSIHKALISESVHSPNRASIRVIKYFLSTIVRMIKHCKIPHILLRPPSIFYLTTNPHNLLRLQPSVSKFHPNIEQPSLSLLPPTTITPPLSSPNPSVD